jgi:hypothetical protein
MTQHLAYIDFLPRLPLWLLAVFALIALIFLAYGVYQRARGIWWRALAAVILLGALGNPRLLREERETRPDIAILAVDRSDSTGIADRAERIAAARAALEARAARLPALDLRVIEVPEAGQRGTALFSALGAALADVPRARLAGVIALTDGQVHDAPALLPFDAPFHVLLPGRAGEIDRRLRLVSAPGFGIVGQQVELRVVIEDLGAASSGNAGLIIRRDGGAPRREEIPIGREHAISVPIARGGPLVIELEAEPRAGEVSALNNRQVVTVNGVRDRLRVLLVSGEPHAGERAWRRLLKADPNVDLVHFTILRPPEKDDLTPLNELALIAFPVRELFQVKLREFDLIVFDRFTNRGLLPPAYMRNIADHVRAGGALLMSVGPEFAGPASLAFTPLSQVLPARPMGRGAGVEEGPFRPRISTLGARHPVTEALSGANSSATEASWGRWYRWLRGEARGGMAVMESPEGTPLLVLDRVGEGRVALLMSDHIWLWGRGHDGGGPQEELLRRIAHWLMRETTLEEEDLTARIDGGRMAIARRSLEAAPPPEVTITAPDGARSTVRLEEAGGGRAIADVAARMPGVWQVGDGKRVAFAAAAVANPMEIADLRADGEKLRPLVQGRGAIRWLGQDAAPALPELRMVPPGREASGAGWIGLRRNADHSVISISALPLLPPWLALLLLLGTVVLAWRQEGR